MTVGTFTVGRDAQAVFIAPNGTRLDMTGLTDYDWKPQYKTARAEPLNAPPIERELPYGHRITFNIDRINNSGERLVSQIEQGWWSVGSADAGTSASGAAYFFINEADGSQTTHQFRGCSIKMTNGGSAKTDAPMKQSWEVHAQLFQVV